MTRYFYGDSSPSPLGFNFIEFLPLAVDSCVEVLLSELRMRRRRRHRDELRQRAERDGQDLVALASTIQNALESATRDARPGGPLTRCGDLVIGASTDAIEKERERLAASLAAEERRIEEAAADERKRCARAMETLLLAYDPPGAETSVAVELSDGDRYDARLRGATPYGATYEIGLEAARVSQLAAPLRVGELAPDFELRIPERGGWIRKKPRVIAEKMAKYIVTRLNLDGAGMDFDLRAARDGAARGVRVAVRDRKAELRAHELGPSEAEPLSFELEDRDVERLRALGAELRAMAEELRGFRQSVTRLRLDDCDLARHEEPAVFVERLIAAMSPVVRDIREHSSSPSELVLRRPLEGSRREEFFVTAESILERLDALPQGLRRHCAPLFRALGAAEREVADIPDASDSIEIHEEATESSVSIEIVPDPSS